MPLRKEFEYPPDEELNIQEVNISLPYLRAAAFHLYKNCETANNEFMLCKQENNDPRACLKEGRDVTNCSLNFFRKVKKSCADEFTAHAKCLYMSSCEWNYKECRSTQKAYDDCMLEKLDMPRAYFAEPTEIKIHHTERPRPLEKPAYYPDAPTPWANVDKKDYGEPRFKIRSWYFD